MLIGLVGEKFSGKDTVANYIASRYHADHIRFSHVLDDILKVLHLPISRQNEINLGLGLRRIFGDGVLAKAVLARIQNSDKANKVVNGIRMDEFDTIKNLGAAMLYITAPVETRFARYQKRHEKADDASMDYGAFLEQDKGPTEATIPQLGARADFKIENTGSLEELYQKVDDVISKLKDQNAK